MKYQFKMHKEKKGYWAECVELKGCTSQGDSLEELKENLSEALNLYLNEPEDSQVIFPFPKKNIQKRNILEVEVDPQVALSLLIRTERLKRRWTQQVAAKEIGIPLYSYQKLESSKTANPEWKTLIKLKQVFSGLNINLAVS